MLVEFRDGSKFLSTPSARRATPGKRPQAVHGSISIHALREEGDGCKQGLSHPADISIHALREEGDTLHVKNLVIEAEFLSTPSARRATHCTSKIS